MEPLPIITEPSITLSQLYEWLPKYINTLDHTLVSLCETEQDIADNEITLFLDYVQNQLFG